MHHADDVLRLASQTGRGVGPRQHLLDDLLGRLVDVDRAHVGAVDHDVGHLELAEAEEVVDVLGLALLHLAVLGRNLDQALDLDVGQDVLVRGFPDAEQRAGSRARRR